MNGAWIFLVIGTAYCLFVLWVLYPRKKEIAIIDVGVDIWDVGVDVDIWASGKKYWAELHPPGHNCYQCLHVADIYPLIGCECWLCTHRRKNLLRSR